jgi:hypothetical protein
LKGEEPVPSIPVTTEVGGKPLFAQATLDSLVAYATKDQDGRGRPQVGFTDAEKKASSWSVLSLRFDPCAPARPPARLCLVQVRLVAQPLQRVPLDKPVHLVFTLGTLDAVPPGLGVSKVPDATMRRLVDGLVAIKKASAGRTIGAPLGVHPGLLFEPTQAPVAAAVRRFIDDAVPLAARRNVAMVAVRDPRTVAGRTNDVWEFFAGDVDGAGAFVPQPIPVFPDGTTIQQFSALDRPDRRVSPQPPSSVVTSSGLFETRPADRDLAKTFFLDNPTKVDFFSTDCVSCHTTTQRTMVNIDRFDFTDAARYAVPAGITAYARGQNLQGSTRGSTEVKWNFRNFGYFGSPPKPTVTFRAVNETAEVVKAMNTRFLGAGDGVFGPGPLCAGKEPNVLRCFATGGASCLSVCAPSP